jgi:hypothetical protein
MRWDESLLLSFIFRGPEKQRTCFFRHYFAEWISEMIYTSYSKECHGAKMETSDFLYRIHAATVL